MLLISLFSLLLTSVPALAQGGQVGFDAIHNATSITGTWSSGSKAVLTGAGFANPANRTFSYPRTTGVCYSFTDDGFYEIARYRFNGNGSQPTCITGVLNWVHGKYEFQTNGSIVMTPFGDGYQQIQDPCAAQSNFIEDYNITELFVEWRIFMDPSQGPKLHLFQFDGSPVAPLFQVSVTPEMLPTQLLRNVTQQAPQIQSQDGFVSTGNTGNTGNALFVSKPASAGVRQLGDVMGVSVIIAGLAGVGSLALLLL